MATASTLLSTTEKRLEGKVALITGGASGIGACAARLFAAHGAKVVIADVQDDLGHSVSNELRSPTSSPSFVHCDVTDEAEVKNAVDFAVSEHGKLDIMYNNAGVIDIVRKSILDNTKDDFERILKTNLVGAFLGTKHAARAMIPACSGSIIATASICSVMGGIATHAYTSSKHGVAGLMKNVAVELGRHGIRVNCVSPHLEATPLVKEFFGMGEERVSMVYSNLKGKYCTAEDVAEAALYLASDQSKFLSGVNLVVDGGFTIMNSGFCMFE